MRECSERRDIRSSGALARRGCLEQVVRRNDESLRLDWSADSAFRFFPVQQDEDFGYCLHPADIATNKLLALVGRSEMRDFLDILQVDETYLSLGATIWAACGKDPGYNPSMILDMTNRHSRSKKATYEFRISFVRSNLKTLKRQWIAAQERAVDLFFAVAR